MNVLAFRVRIVSLADRSGYIMSPSGLNREQLPCNAAQTKMETVRLDNGTATNGPAQMVEDALAYRLSRPILVDVSDSGVALRGIFVCIEPRL